MSFSNRLPKPTYSFNPPVVNTAYFPEFNVSYSSAGAEYTKKLTLTVRLPYTAYYKIDGINNTTPIPVQQFKDVIIGIINQYAE